LEGGAVRKDEPGVFVGNNALAPVLTDCSDASLGSF
jgi:hypothetical protein